MGHRGCVALVGAGPGDPDLLTVGGLRRLRGADVVVYDRLIHPDVLLEAPAHAERVFAGKAAGRVVLGQRAIEALLIERARAGKRVVRLKGGDPYLFGRGGEEVEALAAAGVPYEVIPGVTSAVGGPAAAGVPVTHRDLASVVTIVTAHEDPLKADAAVDWDWLARGGGTVVVLMGLERLEAVCSRLVRGGRAGSTPAAVVSAATMPHQRSVFAPLAELPVAARLAELPSPALIVVGEVARFPDIVAGAGLQALAPAV